FPVLKPSTWAGSPCHELGVRIYWAGMTRAGFYPRAAALFVDLLAFALAAHAVVLADIVANQQFNTNDFGTVTGVGAVLVVVEIVGCFRALRADGLALHDLAAGTAVFHRAAAESPRGFAPVLAEAATTDVTTADNGAPATVEA